MVGFLQNISIELIAEQATPTKLLTEPTRTITLMALLGIALLGMLMIVSTMLGGHWVRRLGKHRRGPSVPLDVRPLSKSQTISPKISQNDIEAGETLGSDETLSG